jgi:hypothetical protein
MHSLKNLANTEIANLDCPVGIEEDVGGLDISMQDLVGVYAF